MKAVSKNKLQGWTPLHYAAARGRIAVVDTLLAHGADAKAAGKDGWTPLHGAAGKATARSSTRC